MGILATSFVELDPKSSTPFCIGKSTSTSVGIFKGAADSASKVELMNIAADGTITFNGTVNTPTMAIADASVTEAKIANNAVTTDKIKNSAVTGEKLASACVTSDKLDPTIVSGLQTQIDALNNKFDTLDASSTAILATGTFDTAVTATELNITSDIRMKENLEEITDASEKVRMLKAYTYNLIGQDNRTAGIIAQDLVKVLPEGVVTNPETGIMSVNYSAVIALLVNALNEKQSDIEQLTARLEKLEAVCQNV